jgi:hypothetical protein
MGHDAHDDYSRALNQQDPFSATFPMIPGMDYQIMAARVHVGLVVASFDVYGV